MCNLFDVDSVLDSWEEALFCFSFGVLCCVVLCFVFGVLRQGFSVESALAWNSLVDQAYLEIIRFTCFSLCPLSARIKGMHLHTRLSTVLH